MQKNRLVREYLHSFILKHKLHFHFLLSTKYTNGLIYVRHERHRTIVEHWITGKFYTHKRKQKETKVIKNKSKHFNDDGDLHLLFKKTYLGSSVTHVLFPSLSPVDISTIFWSQKERERKMIFTVGCFTVLTFKSLNGCIKIPSGSLDFCNNALLSGILVNVHRKILWNENETIKE